MIVRPIGSFVHPVSWEVVQAGYGLGPATSERASEGRPGRGEETNPRTLAEMPGAPSCASGSSSTLKPGENSVIEILDWIYVMGVPVTVGH